MIGAAQAAASWIRARRSAWSDAPLELPSAPPAPHEPSPAAEGHVAPAIAFDRPVSIPAAAVD